MTKLINLVYGSSTTTPFSDEELLALLAKSREKNRRLGVTGLLLYRERNFLQVLEGEEQAVWEIYNKIVEDPRHSSILLYGVRPVTERLFGDWEMGFLNLEKDKLDKVEGYSDFLSEPLNSSKFQEGEFAYIFLRTFRDFIR